MALKSLQVQHKIIAIGFIPLTTLWIAIRLSAPSRVLLDSDGGHQLAGALQILKGEHPFVDFEATYGPLTFYASAFAQLIFGHRYIGEVVLSTVGFGLAYVVLALSIYKVTKKAGMAILFGALALAAIPRLYKYYIVLGPVLTLWFALKYIEKPKPNNIIWLALAIVIAGLFRSDFGVYCMFAGTLAVALEPSFKTNGFKRMLTLWGEALLFTLPYLLFLAVNRGLDNYFGDMLVGGPNIARGMSLPFPTYQTSQVFYSVANLRFLAMIFYFGLPVAASLFLALQWNVLENAEKKTMLICVILYSFSLLQASNRAEYLHLLQAIPLAFLLLAWLINQLSMTLPAASAPGHRTSIFRLLFLAVLCAGLAIPMFLVNQSGWPKMDVRGIPNKIIQYSLPKDKMLANIEKSSGGWYVETMQYIRRCTNENQRLMALPALTTFYYFTDRAFGGGQIGIVSGYFVTEKDQERIISKMSRQDIPLIVYLPNSLSDNLEERRFEVVAANVARYIDKNYAQITKVGDALLLLRRDLVIEKHEGGLKDFSCPEPGN